MEKSYKKSNLWKAKNNLKKLAQANFGKDSKFLTLTFNNENDFDITDIKSCNNKYSLFIRRLSRKFPGFKYITVLEFQKRGAVHYHILCNIGFKFKSELQELWGHGYIQINRVRTSSHIVRYISKYMMKHAEDERFINHRRYFCSQNLVKPIRLGPHESTHLLELIRRKQLAPVASYKYFAHCNGLIAVEQYNLEQLTAHESNK